MIFFGTGTGRCGTMTLSNALSREPNTLCLHEGMQRHGTIKGEQWLPYLTLQNLAAYQDPHKASSILQYTRADMETRRVSEGLTRLGDVAYNYAPFVHSIPDLFPNARLIVLVRDGRDFVRSAYTNEVPDPTPVGWLDEDRPSTRLERFVSMGRLRPTENSPAGTRWNSLSPVGKNAWLWAETNRIILDGLHTWNPEQTMIVKAEALFQNTHQTYQQVRDFLKLTGEASDEVWQVFEAPINRRHSRALPPWSQWSDHAKAEFLYEAQTMMERLGYPITP